MSVVFTPTLSLAVTQGSGSGTTVGTGTFSNTQESLKSWDFSLSASQTDYALTNAALTKTKIKAMFFLFDTAITLETNSSSAPAETWTFVANVPYYWDVSHPVANPLVGDVTAIYLTNGAAATAVKIYVLLDN